MNKKREANQIETIKKRKALKRWPSLKTIESYAQIITPFILLVTLIVAIVGVVAAYTDYQARIRPYLAVKGIDFDKYDNENVCLMIDLTNLGSEPATGVTIEKLIVCTMSTEICKLIEWSPSKTDSEQDISVFKERINRIRVNIAAEDYKEILAAKILEVELRYSFGNKEYWYKSIIRLKVDNQVEANDWIIEGERGN